MDSPPTDSPASPPHSTTARHRGTASSDTSRTTWLSAAGSAREFSWDDTVKDVAAAVEVLAGEGLKVGSVGYCWGGTISFLAGVRLDVNAAVVYYGGQILPYKHQKARCPMLMHFGEHDAGIPLSDVEQIKAAHPEATVHVYDAGHGFNCDHRGSYDQHAARLARERTIEFFNTSLT